MVHSWVTSARSTKLKYGIGEAHEACKSENGQKILFYCLYFLLFIYLIESHVVQATLKYSSEELGTSPAKCRDYRCALPHPVCDILRLNPEHHGCC